jgi:hypothetical protein
LHGKRTRLAPRGFLAERKVVGQPAGPCRETFTGAAAIVRYPIDPLLPTAGGRGIALLGYQRVKRNVFKTRETSKSLTPDRWMRRTAHGGGESSAHLTSYSTASVIDQDTTKRGGELRAAWEEAGGAVGGGEAADGVAAESREPPVPGRAARCGGRLGSAPRRLSGGGEGGRVLHGPESGRVLHGPGHARRTIIKCCIVNLSPYSSVPYIAKLVSIYFFLIYVLIYFGKNIPSFQNLAN